ncbi:hypothetical protein M3Y99_00376200 [Aphelenchoides fujianensis]|nr:hypothetical protein M3Y99_00376200 [Aphelenchoides fujianensis]
MPKSVRKTAGPPARRKYTEGNNATCSADKQTAAGRSATAVNVSRPTAQKFVHKPASRSKPSADTTSEHSRPQNAKQRACRQWFESISAGGINAIRRDFQRHVIKYKPADMTTEHFDAEANLPKNRYDDIPLLDQTRVEVKINPDGDDYIHASHVQVSDGLRLICAQGPLSNTVAQFLLMCVQEGVIVQLCKNVEKGQEKCADYFPPHGSPEWADHGPVQVRVAERGALVPGMRRVKKTKLEIRFKGRLHALTHLGYEGWPDHGMPESIPTCRELRTLVHKLHEKKPVVVHCAAGIGESPFRFSFAHPCPLQAARAPSPPSRWSATGCWRRSAATSASSRPSRSSGGNGRAPSRTTTCVPRPTARPLPFQQYLAIFRCVIEVLLHEDGLSKTDDVKAFIQEYDDFVARKQQEMAAAAAGRSRRN